jgi:hypothetical protein
MVNGDRRPGRVEADNWAISTPMPSMSQASGLPGRRTATSIPITTVGSKAINCTSWATDPPDDATSSRAPTSLRAGTRVGRLGLSARGRR